ncbi:hypothetical protein INT44_002283 [Umbelopsis vinacea]|uniref:Uncharacterized protein n=1 Tax=Umbelopsis vinacea TaxID=44442 RepID=A0A8H7Q3Y9_9FUNG|nr:hypothetical protein INT44_002283 [Umbelopsis vinacea]
MAAAAAPGTSQPASSSSPGTSQPASASSPATSSAATAASSSPAASGQSSQAQQQTPSQPSATPAGGIQIPINPPNSAHHSMATGWTAVALLLVTCVFWHL